ncbi:MAG: Gfo/Idh/MocA family oxidoreductase [Chloroflexi bacterium]|nr:Gfo/Idh/MocA family oxidoreductase [Chloroflexota bacterium]
MAMKIGIIGYSAYVRRAYIPYFKTHSEIELSAVCDILGLPELTELITKAGFDSRPLLFHDLAEMLATIDIDAVIVSTPHSFHFDQVKTCLEAGKHVLVDKPISCRFRDAQALVEFAELKGLKLAVGNQRRYESPYRHIKARIAEGGMGEIKLVNYLFASSPWYNYAQSWRGDSDLNCGGAMIDIGHLAADMLVWLLDRPLCWVFADALTSGIKHVEQSVAILAEFEPHVLVSLTVSYEAPANSVQEELSIYGSRSNIFTRRFQPKRSIQPPILIEESTEGHVQEIVFTDLPEHWRPFEDFLRGIRTGSPIISDGRSNLGTIELIDAINRSVREQNKIHVRDN